MDLDKYASQAEDMREASALAGGIKDNLITISKGVPGEARIRSVEQVDIWFRGLADKLGYKVESTS